MKILLYKFFLALLYCFFSISVYCQSISLSVVNSTGGYIKSGYYQFEWNVGEMALVDEMSTNSLVVTNGFLQPYLLYPASNNSTSEFGKEEIKIFPNPASSYIEINFFTKQRGHLKIELLNALGQEIYKREINSYGVDLIHTIPVHHLRGGIYLVYITLDPDAGSVSKKGIYKIVKTDR